MMSVYTVTIICIINTGCYGMKVPTKTHVEMYYLPLTMCVTLSKLHNLCFSFFTDETISRNNGYWSHRVMFLKNVKKLKEIKCNNVKIANYKKNLEQILYILSSVLIFFLNGLRPSCEQQVKMPYWIALCF